MTEGVVRLYVRDLLEVNSDVTMHIISSLSSMDEANRLFAISGCGCNYLPQIGRASCRERV